LLPFAYVLPGAISSARLSVAEEKYRAELERASEIGWNYQRNSVLNINREV
jgi:hypothetical protein